jgi:hypothetical protein
MVTQQTTMTVTKQALIVRIPWDALVQHIKPKPYDKIRFTIEDVLRLVEEGRHAHRLGKTKAVRSLSELKS